MSVDKVYLRRYILYELQKGSNASVTLLPTYFATVSLTTGIIPRYKSACILSKARKEDLRLLAEELNLNVGDNVKIADLSKLITTHPDYDEFSKNQLTIIVEDRRLREQREEVREQQEMVQKQQQELVREQQEFEKERERLDREFQLEKLRLEIERLKGLTSTPEAKIAHEKNLSLRIFESFSPDPGQPSFFPALECPEHLQSYWCTVIVLVKKRCTQSAVLQ
ncbi:hypothetical protein TNCV_2715661 [Trichonephila clavipes]|nr:hypothetical protein TNCV_2715661 [Trichonephila clavipes]